LNISEKDLLAQYNRADKAWPFIHGIAAARGMPVYLLHALGSRETGLANIKGDFQDGEPHGFGVWQRDIGNGIPPGWLDDVRAQCVWSADFLASQFKRFGSWEQACNAYNSGQPKTELTTGHDYGSDVMQRRATLEKALGGPSITQGGFEAVESLLGIKSGLVVDVAQQSADNRATVQQAVITGRKSQSIVFEPDGAATRIKFEHSGKYLDGDPARLEVVQFEKAAVPWQLWNLTWADVGWRIANVASGNVLDIEGASTAPGARMIQWPWNGGANQLFVRARFC